MIWLHGATGRMGQEIQSAAARQSLVLSGLSSRSGGAGSQGLAAHLAAAETRLVLDFSSADGNEALLKACEQGQARGKAVLIGTTGMSDSVLGRWRTLTQNAELALLVAPNTSVGILLVAKAAMRFASELSGLSYDIEIVETHHRHKKDAPSGTASFLAQSITRSEPSLKPRWHREGSRETGEIGITSVRGGGVFGEHEIRFIGEADEITLSHRAFSRRLFAEGALVLGRWLLKQKPGIYGLLDVEL